MQTTTTYPQVKKTSTNRLHHFSNIGRTEWICILCEFVKNKNVFEPRFDLITTYPSNAVYHNIDELETKRQIIAILLDEIEYSAFVWLHYGRRIVSMCVYECVHDMHVTILCRRRAWFFRIPILRRKSRENCAEIQLWTATLLLTCQNVY